MCVSAPPFVVTETVIEVRATALVMITVVVPVEVILIPLTALLRTYELASTTHPEFNEAVAVLMLGAVEPTTTV